MPKSSPPALNLEDKERQQLQQLVNRHHTPQQLALRASIILLADEGHNHREIARELNISRDMARLWRTRWLILSQKDIAVEERLQDAQRSGAPATFSLEQIVKLFAIACEPPEVYERPISQWTARELADEMVKQGIVENISPRHVGRLLEEASLKPHQSGYWLNPPPTVCSTTKSKTSVTSISAHQKGLRLEREPSVSTK